MLLTINLKNGLLQAFIHDGKVYEVMIKDVTPIPVRGFQLRTPGNIAYPAGAPNTGTSILYDDTHKTFALAGCPNTSIGASDMSRGWSFAKVMLNKATMGVVKEGWD